MVQILKFAMLHFLRRLDDMFSGQCLLRLKALALACIVGGCCLANGNCSAQDVKAEAESANAPNSIVAESALLRVIDQVSVPARTVGVLSAIDVKEGQLVKQGALLAKVDDTQEKLIYQRAALEYELAKESAANDIAIRVAEKSLEFSEQEYQRLKRASEGIPGSVSMSELEESRVTAEQAVLEVEKTRHEHKLEGLNEKLKQTEQAVALHNKRIHEIVAPVNGLVVEIMRRQGEWVEPGEKVLRIMRIDRLRVEGLIPFQEVTPDLPGSPVKITVSIPGKPEVTTTGQVVLVNPEINPVNGRVRVCAEFDNPTGRLMPGMRATMTIQPRQVGNSKPVTKGAAQLSTTKVRESKP